MKARARARQWLHYDGDLLAPLCRRFAGAITPVIPWRHYADDLVAWLHHAGDSQAADWLGFLLSSGLHTPRARHLVSIRGAF
jgi:hypothetical protein